MANTKSNPLPHAKVRGTEAGAPRARRILMFPLTRLLIAIGVFLGLQIPIGIVSQNLPAALQSTFLTPTLALIIGVLVYTFITKTLEHRPFSANGLTKKGILRSTLADFAVGAGMMSVIVGLLAITGSYRVSSIALTEPGTETALLSGLVLFLLVGVFEEILFRGVLFRIREEGLGSWLALGSIALIFGTIHLLNDNATFLGALGVALTGTVLTLTYMLTRNLWMAIGIHWSWNFFMGTIYGLPVRVVTRGAACSRPACKVPHYGRGARLV